VSRKEQVYMIGRDVERKYLVAVLVAHVTETRLERFLNWFEYCVAVLRALQIFDLQAVNLRLTTPHEVVVDVVHCVVRPLLTHTHQHNDQSKVFSEVANRLPPVDFYRRRNKETNVTKQLKVSDAVYNDLNELKDEEGHTSFDSVLRTLLLHYRHVQPNESEE